jgi:hypothetical protein
VRGKQAFVEFEVTNAGSLAAQGLSVSVPNAPWLALTTPETLGDLAPGATAKVGLSLRPAADLPLGPYTGNLALNAANGSVTVPFRFDCVSDGKGSLRVIAEDEYTYFADTHPNVSGAKVTLTDVFSGSPVAEGTTDATGMVAFADLPEGHYNLETSADKHGTAKLVAEVTAGQERLVKPFLPRQFVNYLWSVVPVDTEDQYEITLETLFETHVPAPVVTISPSFIDLRQIQGRQTIFFTVTNHGLIAAQNVKLHWADTPRYKLTSPIEGIGNLPALASVVIPITFEDTATLSPQDPNGNNETVSRGAQPLGSESQSLCLVPKVTVTFEYICGIPIPRSVEVGFRGFGPCGEPPYPPPPTGPGEETCPGCPPPPPTTTIIETPFSCCPTEIFKCALGALPIVGCPLSVFFTEAGCAACTSEPTPEQQRSCKISCDVGRFATVVGCIWNIPGALICLGNALNGESCREFFGRLTSSSQSVLASSPASFALGVSTPNDLPSSAIWPHGSRLLQATPIPDADAALDVLKIEIQRLQDIADYYLEIVGDPAWLEVKDEERPVFEAWMSQLKNAVAESSEDGGTISPTERETLKSLPIPSHLTALAVDSFLDRINRTLAYSNMGILRRADVPVGQSTDFIDSEQLSLKQQKVEQNIAQSQAEGNTYIFEGFNKALESYKSALQNPETGVCARVRVRLNQQAVMAQTAFKATLELENNTDSSLSNVTMHLDVRNAEGQTVNNLFGINPPHLTGVSDVDGNGLIDPGMTGGATWTILPSRDAAPLVDTEYFVGGEITYIQNGKLTTIPLAPARILVKPDPLLMFHYFWQRDVYSDDPFTPLVEEPEPFALGLLVSNRGHGTARNLSIASAQPQIIENEKGLLVDFKIIGSQVNDHEVSPSLKVDLGDVGPDETAAARWFMTSTLQGKFIDYNASFEHVDGLGNPRLSLIDSVNLHELEHVVRVDTPNDDGKPDFLANDVPDDDHLPDILYSSDGTTAPVTPLTQAAFDGPPSYNRLQVQMTLPTPPNGWVYLRADDPGQEQFKLLKVIRSDGKELRMDDNAWTTHRAIRLQGQDPFRQHRLYLFDFNPTETYTLVYGPPPPTEYSTGRTKTLGDGASVILGTDVPVVVTAVFSEGFYVEAQDRSSGIKVTGGSAQEGQLVQVAGVLRTAPNGERYVEASSVTPSGNGAIEPLGLTTKGFYGGDFFYDPATGAGQKGMIGGAGLNPVGLLVSTLGQVTAFDASTVSITDGYHPPITVQLPVGSATPPVGNFIGVTGIVSIQASAEGLLPVLRPRGLRDLTLDLAPLQATFTAPIATLAAGSNLFSLPGIPDQPSLPDVLAGVATGDGANLNGRITRYDAPTQSEVFWQSGQPDLFGSLLLGEGYRLELSPGDPTDLAFRGFNPDFADRFISLPRQGATRIGTPYSFAVDWEQVLVTDGMKTVTLRQAAKEEFPNWVNSLARYFDNVSQTDQYLGLSEDHPDRTHLEPWQGYWMISLKDNLALIVPAPKTPPTESASPKGGLYNQAQTVTLTASKLGSVIRYTLDGSDPTSSSPIYSQPLSITATTTLRFQATDPGGLLSEVYQEVYTIDTSLPSVQAVPDRAPDHNGWYTHPLTVTFLGTDEGGSVECDAPIAYSGPDAETALSGGCADGAGNRSTTEFALKYDATAPVSQAQLQGSQSNGVYTGPVQITLSASDNKSGVARILYRLDGTGPMAPYSTPFSVTSGGAHTVEYQAEDQAGNQETIQSRSFAVALTPVISNLAVVNVQSTTAQVTWTTDLPSDSQVEYGATTAYGKGASDGNPTTSHTITLTGLAAGTTYHFRVKSAPTSGGTAASADGVFLTPAAQTGQTLGSALTRAGGAGAVIAVNVTVYNHTTTALTNARLTAATLRGTTSAAPTTVLPVILTAPGSAAGSIPAGGSATVTLLFPASVGASGSAGSLSVTWSSSAGNVAAGSRLTLP